MTLRGELRVVDDVAAAFAGLVADESPLSIALSGGSTAAAAYAAIAGRSPTPDWSSVDVWWGDERFVPVDDPDSNEGLARRVLLDHLPVRATHSMRGTASDIEAAARAYDAAVGATPPIQLLHLGLGPDGHTASLFPDSSALDVTDRLVVATGDAFHPQPRLTFTLPAIARCELVVFTVAGREKAAAFAAVREGHELPAARVDAARVIWLVDPAALGSA